MISPVTGRVTTGRRVRPQCVETVSVLVCTRDRPEELARLLESLSALRFRRVAEARFDVTIIDNTPGGTPGLAAESASDVVGVPVAVVREAALGIPFARNAALAHHNPQADWVAFIDDDETATPSWLDHLLDTAHRYRADLVSGPALTRVPSSTPAEVKEYLGAWSANTRMPTGTPRGCAATNNLLIRVGFLGAHELRFDERYGLGGGSDSDFTRRAHRLGARIVRCDRAIVWHWFGEARANADWVCRRVFRSHHGEGESVRADGARRTQARLMLRSLWLIGSRLVAGSALRVIGDDRRIFRARAARAAGNGMMSGLIGRPRPEEYRTVAGA